MQKLAHHWKHGWIPIDSPLNTKTPDARVAEKRKAAGRHRDTTILGSSVMHKGERIGDVGPLRNPDGSLSGNKFYARPKGGKRHNVVYGSKTEAAGALVLQHTGG